jgi:hypothetical protein
MDHREMPADGGLVQRCVACIVAGPGQARIASEFTLDTRKTSSSRGIQKSGDSFR